MIFENSISSHAPLIENYEYLMELSCLNVSQYTRHTLKLNLLKRKIIPAGRCVLCQEKDEEASHLFFSCSWVYEVWMEIMKWLGFKSVFHSTCSVHFFSFNSFFPNKKSALNGMLIWLATIWEIWLDRNNVIFRDKLFIIEEVFEACRRRSWEWFKCYAKGGALGLTYSC